MFRESNIFQILGKDSRSSKKWILINNHIKYKELVKIHLFDKNINLDFYIDPISNSSGWLYIKYKDNLSIRYIFNELWSEQKILTNKFINIVNTILIDKSVNKSNLHSKYSDEFIINLNNNPLTNKLTLLFKIKTPFYELTDDIIPYFDKIKNLYFCYRENDAIHLILDISSLRNSFI